MNKYNLMLIMFMSGKGWRLNDVEGVNKQLYFSKEDRKALVALSVEEACKMWHLLNIQIKKEDTNCLGAETCIFCFMYDIECSTCCYGERHGVCNEIKFDNNDYGTIVRLIDSSDVHISKLLPSKFYIHLVAKIERKAKRIEQTKVKWY